MPGQSGGEVQADPYSPEITADLAEASTETRRFTGQAHDYGVFRPVSELVDEQADRHPGRPAVTYDDRTLSYAEMDALVNGLARALGDHGVSAGDVVPLLLVNSLELPIAYLALMRLGAVFVPLDPDWPQDRLAEVFDVLTPAIVLCAGPGSVPEEYRDRAYRVDAGSIAPAPRLQSVPLGPDDLVYGYFTSGTTGTPKCAMNLHGGLTNRLRYMERYFGSGFEVVLQNSKHTFDSSLWQMFLPLTTGGHAVLPVQGEFLNLQQTIDTIAEHGVTATDFVSSIFNALAAVADGDEEVLGKLSSLRQLIVGSEPLNPPAVHRMMEQLPDLRVTNGYGPTEASIGMVFHPSPPPTATRSRSDGRSTTATRWWSTRSCGRCRPAPPARSSSAACASARGTTAPRRRPRRRSSATPSPR